MSIDDCDARCRIDRAIEQQALGCEVVLHGLVIVEMIARQVGENRDIEGDSGGAALGECVARDLGDQLSRATAYSHSQQFEEIRAIQA